MTRRAPLTDDRVRAAEAILWPVATDCPHPWLRRYATMKLGELYDDAGAVWLGPDPTVLPDDLDLPR